MAGFFVVGVSGRVGRWVMVMMMKVTKMYDTVEQKQQLAGFQSSKPLYVVFFMKYLVTLFVSRATRGSVRTKVATTLQTSSSPWSVKS